MFLIMLQHRVAEVVVEVAVNTVNVIGFILSIVVLNQKRRALNEIVVRFAGLETAGPNEMDLLRARTIDASQILIREFLADATDVRAYELHKKLALLYRHRRHD